MLRQGYVGRYLIYRCQSCRYQHSTRRRTLFLVVVVNSTKVNYAWHLTKKSSNCSIEISTDDRKKHPTIPKFADFGSAISLFAESDMPIILYSITCLWIDCGFKSSTLMAPIAQSTCVYELLITSLVVAPCNCTIDNGRLSVANPISIAPTLTSTFSWMLSICFRREGFTMFTGK